MLEAWCAWIEQRMRQVVGLECCPRHSVLKHGGDQETLGGHLAKVLGQSTA